MLQAPKNNNIFEDMGFSPEEAKELQFRSFLMTIIINPTTANNPPSPFVLVFLETNTAAPPSSTKRMACNPTTSKSMYVKLPTKTSV